MLTKHEKEVFKNMSEINKCGKALVRVGSLREGDLTVTISALRKINRAMGASDELYNKLLYNLDDEL